MQPTLRATRRTRHGVSRLGKQCLPGRRKVGVLRPGTVGMRGSMVIRLQPCGISSTSTHLHLHRLPSPPRSPPCSPTPPDLLPLSPPPRPCMRPLGFTGGVLSLRFGCGGPRRRGRRRGDWPVRRPGRRCGDGVKKSQRNHPPPPRRQSLFLSYWRRSSKFACVCRWAGGGSGGGVLLHCLPWSFDR